MRWLSIRRLRQPAAPPPRVFLDRDSSLVNCPMNAERNLLIGMVALEMEFINRDQLIAAMQLWVLDKNRALGQILLDHENLSTEEHAVLNAVVDKHFERRGSVSGEVADDGLTSVRSIQMARDVLQQVKDPDLDSSLAELTVSLGISDDVAAAERVSVAGSTSLGSRFRILRRHAKGGLGEVFVAEDEELGREVALKEIQPHHADDPNHRSRFIAEARITGRLEHPGIVPVYGLGNYADGRPYYAMRLIRGESLQSAIDNYHRLDHHAGAPGAWPSSFADF